MVRIWVLGVSLPAKFGGSSRARVGEVSSSAKITTTCSRLATPDPVDIKPTVRNVQGPSHSPTHLLLTLSQWQRTFQTVRKPESSPRGRTHRKAENVRWRRDSNK